VYGAAPPHSGGTDTPLTVGVQKNATLFTEVGCDPSGTTPPVVSGHAFTFTLPPCATQTPTLAPTSTPTNTPLPPPRTPTHLPTRATTARPTATAPGPTATPCPISFSDVHDTDYFYEPVRYLYCHEVISGYADGTFRPYANTTRAQMVKIVVLGFGIPITTPTTPTFSDVPTSNPFYPFVETAVAPKNGSRHNDRTIRPKHHTTRRHRF